MKIKYVVIYNGWTWGIGTPLALDDGALFDTLEECQEWAKKKREEVIRNGKGIAHARLLNGEKRFEPRFYISKIEYDEQAIKPVWSECCGSKYIIFVPLAEHREEELVFGDVNEIMSI